MISCSLRSRRRSSGPRIALPRERRACHDPGEPEPASPGKKKGSAAKAEPRNHPPTAVASGNQGVTSVTTLDQHSDNCPSSARSQGAEAKKAPYGFDPEGNPWPCCMSLMRAGPATVSPYPARSASTSATARFRCKIPPSHGGLPDALLLPLSAPQARHWLAGPHSHETE